MRRRAKVFPRYFGIAFGFAVRDPDKHLLKGLPEPERLY